MLGVVEPSAIVMTFELTHTQGSKLAGRPLGPVVDAARDRETTTLEGEVP